MKINVQHIHDEDEATWRCTTMSALVMALEIREDSEIKKTVMTDIHLMCCLFLKNCAYSTTCI
jgi:hypothetical protein